MNNSLIELSNDISVITAEINAYQKVAGEAIFEMGRRLKHVKENDLVHGEFGQWLEEIGFNHSTANKLMKIVTELDGKSDTYPKLSFNVLVQIATMSEEQRDKPHTIPSTGATKTVDEMTVRELREVKKALKQSEEDKRTLGQLLTEERNKPKEVEYVERISDSGTESELQRYKEMFGDISVYEADYKFVGSSSKVSAAIQRFIHKQRKLIDEFSFLRNYSSAVDKIPSPVRDDYELLLRALNDL